jgi:hypothetical protein
LCSACAQGYGLTRHFTCRKCASADVVGCLLGVAALLLMCFVRLTAHLANTSDIRAAAAAAAATSGQQAAVSAQHVVMQQKPSPRNGPPGEAVPMQHSEQPPSRLGGTWEVPGASSHSSDAEDVALPSSLLKVLVLYMQVGEPSF